MSRAIVIMSVLLIACGSHKRSDPGTAAVDSGTGGNADAAVCGSASIKAERVPLDMFIMLDQSSSMSDSVSTGGSKWTAVTSAITAFVQQPNLDEVSVGLQYFALRPNGGTGPTCTTLFCNSDSDCGPTACGPCSSSGTCSNFFSSATSCAPVDYAVAAVEIAPLSTAAAAIVASLAQHQPTTGTPTGPALQGAIDHCAEWATTHEGDTFAVVLATDGEPSNCNTSLAYIDAIAASAVAGTPKILTFVIGVGSSLSALNGIAAAGGTSSAFLVDTGGNTNQQFLDALNAIRRSALGCSYQIPTPTTGMLNYAEVNVTYTAGNGTTSWTLPYVADKASCPALANGWYYDNATNPTKIVLCDPTCSMVSADPDGEVDITLGCATTIL